MKKEGKIIKFDVFCGTILDNENKEYFMPNEEIMSDKLKVNDKVTFEPDVYKTIDVEIKLARFVKKLDRKMKM